MINEASQRSWTVTQALPAKPLFFAGTIEGVSQFYDEWQKALPLTFIESMRVKRELEQLFPSHTFCLTWIGDVVNG